MRAIVSLANKRGNYYQGLARLGDSLKPHFNGNFFGFMGEHTVGAPLHGDNPYAFKLYAIDEVLRQGYTKILWVDSSVYAIKDVSPAFDIIEKNGYLMQEAGHFAGKWTNDNALKHFGVTREQANDMLMYGNAGMLGLDFENGLARAFYTNWRKAMDAGAFKGSWENHRHDMACGSIIANQLGMVYVKGDEVLQYAAQYDVPKNDSIIFYARGL